MKTLTFATHAEAVAKLTMLTGDERALVVLDAGERAELVLHAPDAIVDRLGSISADEALLEEAKRTASNAVNALRDEKIAAGYTHNFGGTAGIRTLDQRSEADAINWLGLKAIADMMVANDQGGELLSIRDAGNATFSASAATVAGAIASMGIWRSGVLAHSWSLKDQIAASAEVAAVEAIDIQAGWSPGED